MQINSIASFSQYDNVDNAFSKIAERTFSDVFHDLKIDKPSIENSFKEMNVTIKTGEIKISKENWNRNDFPVWELFHDNADIEKINNWKPTGSEPALTNSSLQKNLKTIDSGQILIIMPDSVYQKMQNEEQYKEDVVKSVEEWKSNYDLSDNAIAASYGADVGVYQMSKSYCISLDENGNVSKNIVISDSITADREKNETDTIKKNVAGKIQREKREKPQNSFAKIEKNFSDQELDIKDILLKMSVIATNTAKESKK